MGCVICSSSSPLGAQHTAHCQAQQSRHLQGSLPAACFSVAAAAVGVQCDSSLLWPVSGLCTLRHTPNCDVHTAHRQPTAQQRPAGLTALSPSSSCSIRCLVSCCWNTPHTAVLCTPAAVVTAAAAGLLQSAMRLLCYLLTRARCCLPPVCLYVCAPLSPSFLPFHLPACVPLPTPLSRACLPVCLLVRACLSAVPLSVCHCVLCLPPAINR